VLLVTVGAIEQVGFQVASEGIRCLNIALIKMRENTHLWVILISSDG